MRAKLLSTVTLGLTLLPTPATFADYPEELWGKPVDGKHTYCYANMTSSEQEPARYAMRRLRDTTDMTIEYVGYGCGRYFGYNDVTWFSDNLPPGVRGRYVCDDCRGGNSYKGSVYIDFAELIKGEDDWSDIRKTTVHEVGHSVSFRHDSTSAMIQGEVPSTHWRWRSYSASDIDDINRFF